MCLAKLFGVIEAAKANLRKSELAYHQNFGPNIFKIIRVGKDNFKVFCRIIVRFEFIFDRLEFYCVEWRGEEVLKTSGMNTIIINCFVKQKKMCCP